MRLTAHEDGWIYGIFCSESLDPDAAPGDLSSAIAKAGIVRTKDLKNWERLPNLISKSQQRNVVLHPELLTENTHCTLVHKIVLLTPETAEVSAGHSLMI